MIPHLETHILRNRGILDQAYLAFVLVICAVAIWYTPDVAGSPSPEVARHLSLQRRGSLESVAEVALVNPGGINNISSIPHKTLNGVVSTATVRDR